LRRTIIFYAALMLAIGCVSKVAFEAIHTLQPEERVLVSKLTAFYYNGFHKEEGYLWLTTENLIFLNLSRKNQVTIYPLSMASSFRYENNRMVGRIFSFLYQERIVAFSTYFNEYLLKALKEVIEFEE